MKIKYAGTEYSVRTQYYTNSRLALRLFTEEGEPYATLTVNIPEYELEKGEFFIKNWSENKELAKAALESGLFVDTGKQVRSGFVNVPI